jgi:hypothetical protein
MKLEICVWYIISAIPIALDLGIAKVIIGLS